MLYITQLIYLIEGKEEVFNEYENLAIPIIATYNGRLLLRLRPDKQSFIEKSIAKPYEIHLVEFTTENDFSDFVKDETGLQFLHLKEQSIKFTEDGNKGSTQSYSYYKIRMHFEVKMYRVRSSLIG
ncbi:DUF1330 domain-containing protein [Algoriphagus resistens]|uniref:DUF1330 domain-containing protein n=1 Tax=Algoriphagus resistens TaxID=1750590 RepID=UPI000AA05F0C|nr:DUF1330 domain-containing protein [Algoriphagus resistens]